jgi:undecaprenyl-diphosphatase
MDKYQAILIAIIEGLTEYLPVSSTGHMIIATSFMGIASDDFTKLFTIAIQLGAIGAVCVLYFKRFFQSLDFYFKLFVGVIPAFVLGFLLNDFIDSMLENPIVVAISLILGGIMLLFVDDLFKNNQQSEVNYLKAFKIGFYQCLAMIPGVSRSGASIVGGMAEGLNRNTAAEFSFFLAVPTMVAATGKKIYDYYQMGYEINQNEIQLLAIGNLVAFLVALIAIKSFIGILNQYGFKWFGVYRIAVGIMILIIHFGITKLSIH